MKGRYAIVSDLCRVDRGVGAYGVCQDSIVGVPVWVWRAHVLAPQCCQTKCLRRSWLGVQRSTKIQDLVELLAMLQPLCYA